MPDNLTVQPDTPVRQADPATLGVADMLADTRRAFDAVAHNYDGPRGNNVFIRRMRLALWTAVDELAEPGAHLLDLGCGTGLDAFRFAERGYYVHGVDASARMVVRARDRVRSRPVEKRVTVECLGFEDLQELDVAPFDVLYSNLGALNCVPDLRRLASVCATLLRPGGRIVASVIGRYCPWEVLTYFVWGRPRRAFVRLRRGMVPVPLGGATVWTAYHTPKSFYRSFEPHFTLTRYRSLSLFSPPPYLVTMHEHAEELCSRLARVDERIGGWPLLRNIGDHFLIVLTRRG